MTDLPGAKIEPTGQSGSILSFEDFNALYCALTGHDGACRWQHRLFTDLEAGRFPTDIELATGLGKTSIIVLWVLALGRALARKSNAVPRRIAYVVDRRVVVDQASEFAEKVRERLEGAAKDENHALYAIATTLKNAGCTSSVVEVSTLRGQRALDTRWRDDPTRPAIIVGTVDMIGSRLLFSAYGRVGSNVPRTSAGWDRRRGGTRSFRCARSSSGADQRGARRLRDDLETPERRGSPGCRPLAPR